VLILETLNFENFGDEIPEEKLRSPQVQPNTR